MIAATRARRSAALIAVCVARTSSICSPQRITGLSAVIGSWKIIDIRVQRSARSLASPAASSASPSFAMAVFLSGPDSSRLRIARNRMTATCGTPSSSGRTAASQSTISAAAVLAVARNKAVRTEPTVDRVQNVFIR
jgi:hypothetical protein